jgi:hypothetical protein
VQEHPADGATARWRRRLPVVESSPALVDGTLYVGDLDGVVALSES